MKHRRAGEGDAAQPHALAVVEDDQARAWRGGVVLEGIFCSRFPDALPPGLAVAVDGALARDGNVVAVAGRDERLHVVAILSVVAKRIGKDQPRPAFEAQVELAAELDQPGEILTCRHNENASAALFDLRDGAAKGVGIRRLAVGHRAKIRQRDFPAGNIWLSRSNIVTGARRKSKRCSG